MKRIVSLTLVAALLFGSDVVFQTGWPVARLKAAVALVSSTAKGNTIDTLTSDPISTIGATLLVVGVCDITGTATTISDNQTGNTFTKRTVRAHGTSMQVTVWDSIPIDVDASHTFTIGVMGDPTIVVLAFSGTHATAAFDQESGAIASSPASTVQPGSLTPGQNNQVLVDVFGHYSASATINSSFTETADIGHSASEHYGCQASYLIQTTAAAVNPTNTASFNSDMAVWMGTYKQAAAAGTRKFRCGLLVVCQ